jgi:quercetin dioxygenase-like cupin family protein
VKHRPATVVALALAVVFAATASGCAATPAASVASAASSAEAVTPAPTPSPSALATDAPVVVEELGKGEQDAAVDVEVAGPTQVAFRRITIHPGAGTGKHCHDGQLIAVVEQGTFTHYAPAYPGGVHVYQAGDSIVEGAHYVHEGKNEGTDDVVLLVTYVIPEGDPLSETDLTKCDPESAPE